MELTKQELSLFESLKEADFNTLWGLAISNVVKNPEPTSIKRLLYDLKSQANDCKEVMQSIVGESCYYQLINL